MANDSTPIIRKLAYLEQGFTEDDPPVRNSKVYNIGSTVQHVLYNENKTLREYLDEHDSGSSGTAFDFTENNKFLISEVTTEKREGSDEVIITDKKITTIDDDKINFLSVENTKTDYELIDLVICAQYIESDNEIHAWFETQQGQKIETNSIIKKDQCTIKLSSTNTLNAVNDNNNYITWKLEKSILPVDNDPIELKITLKGSNKKDNNNIQTDEIELSNNPCENYRFYAEVVEGTIISIKKILFDSSVGIDDYTNKFLTGKKTRFTDFIYNQLIYYKNSNNRGLLKSSLLDLIYPVGSVYLSISPVNPANLFGGQWRKHENTFLFGSGIHQSGYQNNSNPMTENDTIQTSTKELTITGASTTGNSFIYVSGKELGIANSNSESPGCSLTKPSTSIFKNRVAITTNFTGYTASTVTPKEGEEQKYNSATVSSSAANWQTPYKRVGNHHHTIPTLKAPKSNIDINIPYTTVNVWERIG